MISVKITLAQVALKVISSVMEFVQLALKIVNFVPTLTVVLTVRLDSFWGRIILHVSLVTLLVLNV